MAKLIYRQVVEQILNGKVQHTDYGDYVYGEVSEEKLNETLQLYYSEDYDQFARHLYLNEYLSKELGSKRCWFKKDQYKLVSYSFYETLPFDKKYFKSYEVVKKLEQEHLSIDDIRSNLTAEDYIEWCKDHNIQITM